MGFASCCNPSASFHHSFTTHVPASAKIRPLSLVPHFVLANGFLVAPPRPSLWLSLFSVGSPKQTLNLSRYRVFKFGDCSCSVHCLSLPFRESRGFFLPPWSFFPKRLSFCVSSCHPLDTAPSPMSSRITTLASLRFSLLSLFPRFPPLQR